MSERPNILWLTCEDIGPNLGCYGDDYADTPNLDALAARGVIYRNAWSNAPVCAPARTCIITGAYANSTGAEHMRSFLPISRAMPMYPELLRAAGYWCTNNSKEDYNLEQPGQVWDQSSPEAHWRHRADGRPFFAIFNYTVTHESGIRGRPHDLVHDPARAPVPAYHPDTPEVRHDWAQYYDTITAMDAQAGAALRELEEAGLAEDTIVFFYGDHGSGMPGHKRCARDAGLHVPLIVAIPERFAHLAAEDYARGGASARLVSFVDLAPTVLSLAGVEPPPAMQGRAFMGEHQAAPHRYLYGFRGRMDERYDLVRCCRDERFVYIRNFMPHLPMGQHVRYMFETPSTRMWHELYEAGELTAAQRFFWEPRPPEELYDLQADPEETRNLADAPEHVATRARMRDACREWMLAIRDVGLLPEPQMHARAAGEAPYDLARDPERYPMGRILAAAELASGLDPGATGALLAALEDDDPAVRWWAAMGLQMRGAEAVREGHALLRAALDDEDACVCIAAAEALGRFGDAQDLPALMPRLVELANAEAHGAYLAMLALNAIDHLGRSTAAWREALPALPAADPADDPRHQYGVAALLERAAAAWEA